ncbi:MAG TPA: DUF3617 family protein [Steroidobacteraceae bacterium]|nr:DUF3617 family protein [Steroidobacteraceae bacterium]
MKMRTLILGASLPVLLAACAGTARPVKTALGVKTGLWAVVYGFRDPGGELPKEFVERLSPEQRASYEEVLRLRAKKDPRQRSTAQMCVTAMDLSDGVFNAFNRLPNDNCKVTVRSATAVHQELLFDCNPDGGSAYTRLLTLDAPTNETVKSTMAILDRPVSSAVDLTGTWIGAACPESVK